MNECRQRLDPQTWNLGGRTSNKEDTTAWQRQENVSCLNSQALCGLNPWDTNPSSEDRVLGNTDSMGHDKDGFVSMQDTHISWDTVRCLVRSRTEVHGDQVTGDPIQPKSPSSCYQILPPPVPPDHTPLSSQNQCTFSTTAPTMATLPIFLSVHRKNRENNLFSAEQTAT